ncbi:hypothetical protein BDZ91DRAFT_739565 [Kalaharituber pfeilii]|nr:hypothetical protein BDZ91DRAFT_739565 [Kalaharituber pfeilii]
MAQIDLLQRPLYLYELPPDLLSNLTPRDDAPPPTEDPEPQPRRITTTTTTATTSNPSNDAPATACAVCSFSGRTVEDQRDHARSDFHKLNMKRKIRGQRILSEAEFERMLVDIEDQESISGSEDESEVSDSGRGGTRDEYGETEEVAKKGTNNRSPLLWFKSPLLPSTVSLGIYRALFPADISDHISFIQSKQLKAPPLPSSNSNSLPPPPTPKAPHFFLCMIGGGHFAAMVISLAPVPSNKPGERTATVLAHKTFHRYTTRRKQGGAQSANDAAKGNAHSAGSSLRRYNEAELTKDIRELLASWKTEWIDTAEMLFIRAAGTINRRTLFHYEGAVLKPKDLRIRGFPFSTRRATQSELMRSFVELTRVKVSHLNELLLRSTAPPPPTPIDGNPKTSTISVPSGPRTLKPSKEERELLDHTSTLISLIRRSKVPAMLTYLSAHSISKDFKFFPQVQHRHAPTLLHLAASANAPSVVSALLLKVDCDPTIKSGEGRTAFELAGDRPTRDAFRLARSELGESRWDWQLAKVMAPLTQDDILARQEKEERLKREREERETERRKKEVERLRREEAEREERERRSEALRGGEVVGMSPEARMRLERERRARAAEARIRAMSGGGGAAGGAAGAN